MRCKHVQQLIIDATDRPLSNGERMGMGEHIHQCEGCARFHSTFATLRRGISELPCPTPSGDLDRDTHDLCRGARLASLHFAADPALSKWQALAIPKFIWASLPILIFLTALLMAGGLQDILNQNVSFLSATFLALLLQNAAMLVFAPILIQALRRKRSGHSWNSEDAHAS